MDDIHHHPENVSFIAGSIDEKDLADMGIQIQGHRMRLMAQIEALPPVEFIQNVPEDVEGWLLNLGLEIYWPQFKKEDVKEPKDLAQLKSMDSKDMSTRFSITKQGHLRKLCEAVKFLQYATKAQKILIETRKRMSSGSVRTIGLPDREPEENAFWVKLKEYCLLPEQDAFNQSKELGEKLCEMRTRVFIIWGVANTLWLFFIATITNQALNVQLLGESVGFGDLMGAAFILPFALITIIQLIALMIHRIETLIHFIARASGRLTSDNDHTCEACPDETQNHIGNHSA